MIYYRSELARIHHEAFGDYANLAAPGVISMLGPTTQIIELGCGSGSLTEHLLERGFDVVATDASPAMIELARAEVPAAHPRVLVLPNDPIPTADAVVAVGTVFNYLASVRDIKSGLINAAHAGPLLITDMLDLSYAASRSWPLEFFHEGDGWKLWTINRFEAPNLVVREMTIETVAGKTREVHKNLLIDVESVANELGTTGLEVSVGNSFGDHSLPEGFAVLTVRS